MTSSASRNPTSPTDRRSATSSFITQDLSQPPDPDRGLVAQSCFDLLLIEIVPMAQRIANELHERELQASGELSDSDEDSDKPPEPPPKDDAEKEAKIDEQIPQQLSQRQRMDDDELREATFYRLEAIGYRVGLGVVESLSSTHPLISPTTFLPTPPPSDPSSQSPPPQQPHASHLDTIKFLCKDFWTLTFRKQIDNLKTNHRGVFVLTDMRFEPLRRASLPTNKPLAEAHRRAGAFLFFPIGLVRGALSALGVEAGVQAEVAGVGLPGAVFTIRVGGVGGGVK